MKCQYCGYEDNGELNERQETPVGTVTFCFKNCLSVCRLCEQEADKLEKHHCSYLYDLTIRLCEDCHYRVHHEDGFYDELKPHLTRRKAREIGVSHTFLG